MHDVLSMRGADARCDCANELPGALRRHRAFLRHDRLKRMPVDKLHHEKRHRAARDTKVSNGDDVRMTNGSGRECLLSETRCEHRIITDEIRQDDFDRLLCLEKDVARVKDPTHPALAEPSLERVAGVKCGFAYKGGCSRFTVLGTGAGFVGVATPALGAFFHLIGDYFITTFTRRSGTTIALTTGGP